MLSLPSQPTLEFSASGTVPHDSLYNLQTSRRERVPLEELPTSKSGVVTRRRPPTYRPLPSLDRENVHAFYLANRSREAYVISQLHIIAQQISRVQARRRLAGRSLRRVASRSHRQGADQTAATMPHTRLSMPELSDDSGSEPDLSILGMTRARPVDLAQRVGETDYSVHAQLEAEDTSIEDDLVDDDDLVDEDDVIEHMVDEEQEDGEGEVEGEMGVDRTAAAEEVEGADYQGVLVDPAAMGLKEISNLGKFTVSSHKQGNGVAELRSDDLGLYWQSDGPQPHKLTIYFVKRVGIRDLRFYVNYTEDESYTPTNIIFKSGTSENNLIQFAHMTLDSPVGWQQVALDGAGGGPDGNTLVSYVLQMQILENHQNGKDTHLRGIKVYAFDADSGQAPGPEGNPIEDVVEMMGGSSSGTPGAARLERRQESLRLSGLARRLAETKIETGYAGISIPDFMREPEIR